MGRAILLLIGWTIFGWMPFALVGALLAGAFGATIGFVISFPIGILLLGPYLKLDPTTHPTPDESVR